MSSPCRKGQAAVQTKILPASYDVTAPDGSEIRLLCATDRASTVHCTLPPGAVSKAVAHRGVEEIWYFLAGEGELWRRSGEREEVIRAARGVSAVIPPGTHFQFRNTGGSPLEILIATIPPWPGEDEAYRVAGRWPSR